MGARVCIVSQAACRWIQIGSLLFLLPILHLGPRLHHATSHLHLRTFHIPPLATDPLGAQGHGGTGNPPFRVDRPRDMEGCFKEEHKLAEDLSVEYRLVKMRRGQALVFHGGLCHGGAANPATVEPAPSGTASRPSPPPPPSEPNFVFHARTGPHSGTVGVCSAGRQARQAQGSGMPRSPAEQ